MRQPSFLFRPKNPQDESNCLSKLTFWYTIKIFNKTRRNDLNEEDLTQPLSEHRSASLGERLYILWVDEIKRAKQRQKTPRIQHALYRCFKRQIMGFSVVAIILELIVKISQPLFLKLLLRYYSSDNLEKLKMKPVEESSHTYFMRLFFIYDTRQAPIKIGEAVLYTVGIILSGWLSIAISQPYLMGVMHLGMKMRIACCSLIYRKALKLKIELSSGNMVGNVINLITNDMNRFDNGIMFLPYSVLTPIQVAFITYFLFMEAGMAAIFGIISFIIVIPIQLWLAFWVLSLRYHTALKTDERVREMNELLQAIQVIKMYTWEQVFVNIVSNTRKDEIALLKRMGYVKGILMSFMMISYRFAIFVTVIAYVFMSGQITSEKIFVITAFLLILRQTVSVYYPQLLAQGAELMVSLARLEQFLSMGESLGADQIPLTHRVSGTSIGSKPWDRESALSEQIGVLKIINASARFDNDIILRDIDIEVEPGELTIVIGPVGSGKTSLLHMMLGELTPFKGSVEVKGIISYASQEPWLFPGTIRQNILFGREFNRRRYEDVCIVCALNTDFKLFPEGDRTFVGEKGSALSGGQRARVNLARAIYKDADIYLLDDPLSAVDTQVGQHLFEECINGYISDKIVVLVTHQLQYLEQAEQIVLMKDGSIETMGDYYHLKSAGLDFSRLMMEQLVGEESSKRSFSKDKKSSVTKALAEISRKSIGAVTFIDRDNQIPAIRKTSVEEETIGRIACSVYKEYFKAGSNSMGIFIMFILFLLTQLLASSSDFFISKWIEIEEFKSDSSGTQLSRNSCISIYTVMIILTVVVALARSFNFFNFCMNASKNLHDNMFRGIIETTMNYLHKHSTGAILNRFSKDLGAIDEILPNALIDSLQLCLNLFGVISVVGIVNPYLLIPTFFMCILFYYMRICYLNVSSHIKRLESNARNPVLAHINSTLQGLTTIRCNENEELLTMEFDRHQDIHSSAWFIFIATSRAFGYWLDNICTIYLAVVAVSFLFTTSHGNDVGLSITQTIGLACLFQWGLRQSAEVENQMVSVERVVEYTKLEPEPNLKSDPLHGPPPFDWPSTGKIEFSHTYMRYGPHEAHVLKDVNFLINDKEKVGVVGRTGAGKSSLIATLFRLSYFYGEVRVDNLDISQLCLHDLRKRISIIPQEPILFKGTLLYNLDPYGEHDNTFIMKVLMDLEYKDAVVNGKACLQHLVIEGGANISVGQRQIICLARALIRNNKIIVMDEATANIDAKTDKFIQSIIRIKFSECTVITIAHRLHTIMDSDKVLVMDAGHVAEFDHPHVLLQNSEGIFTSMVEKTGRRMAENLRNIAKETFDKRQ